MKCSGRIIAALLLALVLSAGTCWAVTAGGVATQAAISAEEDKDPFFTEAATEGAATISDPLEPMNRAFFVFNDKLYFWVVNPAAKTYAHLFPPGFRTCVRNAFNNVLFPVRFLNNLLQGKFEGAGVELSRFVINSTLGVGGIFDFAKTQWDINPRPEDFGQTLGVWGLGHGAYLNLPVFGPSSLRDGVGLAGDVAANPLTWIVPFPEDIGVSGGDRLNRASLQLGEYEKFKASALDPYVAMRDGYIQYRNKKVKD